MRAARKNPLRRSVPVVALRARRHPQPVRRGHAAVLVSPYPTSRLSRSRQVARTLAIMASATRKPPEERVQDALDLLSREHGDMSGDNHTRHRAKPMISLLFQEPVLPTAPRRNPSLKMNRLTRMPIMASADDRADEREPRRSRRSRSRRSRSRGEDDAERYDERYDRNAGRSDDTQEHDSETANLPIVSVMSRAAAAGPVV